MLKQFTIDEQYICDVFVREEIDFIKDRKNPTPEDIIKCLKGWDKAVSMYSKDHDEFTKLRNQLEEQGYIVTQRNCWNGDRVLKPFKLNGAQFHKGEKFCSGAAIKWDVEQKQKKKNYRTIG